MSEVGRLTLPSLLLVDLLILPFGGYNKFYVSEVGRLTLPSLLLVDLLILPFFFLSFFFFFGGGGGGVYNNFCVAATIADRVSEVGHIILTSRLLVDVFLSVLILPFFAHIFPLAAIPQTAYLI